MKRLLLLLLIIVGLGFYVWKVFLIPKRVDRQIFGAVVPHDISVEYMNIEMLQKIALQKPKVIVLLAPNHLEKGSEKIVSSGENQSLIKEILDLRIIIVDDEIVNAEYAITNNLGYLSQYLPEIKVVPIVFKKNCSIKQIEGLVDFLISKYDQDWLILSSVDFSHYLNLDQARQKDKETLQAIKENDFERILNFDSSNLDSPASLVTLLMAMQKTRHKNMEIVRYKNSGEIVKNPSVPTTSFFSIVFID